ncbi:hypothetical protein [Sphingomonas faeni]|uniref:hypothetical protein n=1 Tax=Sphingomonas faeni TaxID=185950 RepID=UPI003355B4F8
MNIPQSTGATGPKKTGGNGWLILVVAVALLFAIGKCSSTTGGASSSATVAENVGNAQEALVTAVAAQPPSPPEPLSPAGVRRGAARVSIAAKEELAGEMIYSQNCYDHVARAFSWRKLDECGGFDAEASSALGDGEPVGAEKEVAWFDTEAAAGRYLKAAVAAGLDADVADLRLAALQAKVNARHEVKPEAAPAVATPTGEPDDKSEPTDEEENVTAAV